MRSPARCRHSRNFLHFSGRLLCSDANWLMRSGMDWGICGTRRLRDSHQHPNYVISGWFDRRQSALTPPTENKANNSTSSIWMQSKSKNGFPNWWSTKKSRHGNCRMIRRCICWCSVSSCTYSASTSLSTSQKSMRRNCRASEASPLRTSILFKCELHTQSFCNGV